MCDIAFDDPRSKLKAGNAQSDFKFTFGGDFEMKNQPRLSDKYSNSVGMNLKSAQINRLAAHGLNAPSVM
jgi:hypothetical protein